MRRIETLLSHAALFTLVLGAANCGKNSSGGEGDDDDDAGSASGDDDDDDDDDDDTTSDDDDDDTTTDDDDDDGETTSAELFSVELKVEGMGEVSIKPEKEEFASGEKPTLSAEAANGWRFDHWSGDADGTDATTKLTIDDHDLTVTAVFVEALTLAIKVEGMGEIKIEPEADFYDLGTEVSLTAAPADGWKFDHWSGDLDPSATAEATLEMDGSKEVTAVFVEDTAGDRMNFYTTTWLDNGLDPTDRDDFVTAWKAMGYAEDGFDETITSSTLLELMLRPDLGVLYHTGHGFDGSIQTSDGSVSVDEVETVANQYFIAATCLTLVPTSWIEKMADTCDGVFGYSLESLDQPTDNEVVLDFADAIKNGRNYAQAWYDCNAKQDSLADRWVVYWREATEIVEYSARNDALPPAPVALRKVSNNLSISEDVLRDDRTFANEYAALAKEGLRQVADGSPTSSHFADSNEFLRKVETSKASALRTAATWLRGKLPADVGVPVATSIAARHDDGRVTNAGYRVRYGRTVAGLPLRTNGRSSFVEVVVNGLEVRSHLQTWAKLEHVPQGSTPITGLKSVAELIAAAAPHIARHAKGTVEIVAAQPCAGVDAGRIVPALAFVSRTGLSIVVDASSGRVLD